MVLNHGLLENIKFADMSVDDFKRVYDVNVFSCFAMVSEVLYEYLLHTRQAQLIKSKQWTGQGSTRGATQIQGLCYLGLIWSCLQGCPGLECLWLVQDSSQLACIPPSTRRAGYYEHCHCTRSG
jgi:hypothetical protein